MPERQRPILRSQSPERCCHYLARCLLALWLLAGAASTAQAQESQALEDSGTGTPYAALVTYGPGEVYWQRFGHNAIHLRNPARGIDHLFNFGFFSFQQEGFIRRFIQGRLNYLALARPPVEEFAEYRAAGRSIRVQELALTPAQYQRLEAYLVAQVQPDEREYLYDYFSNNCSTRLRDALDLATGGALASTWQSTPAGLNLRQQVNRTTRADAWLHLGLAAGLGMPVDGPASLWQETFIPAVLADAMEGLENPDTGSLLVMEDTVRFAGEVSAASDSSQLWLRYLLAGMVLAGLLWLLTWRSPKFDSRRGLLPVWGWLLVSGLGGLLLAWLWLFTDHAAVRPSWNILLFNPLLLLPALACLRRPAAPWWPVLAWLAPLGWLLLLGLRLLPDYPQDNAAVVALAAGPVLLLALQLWQRRRMA